MYEYAEKQGADLLSAEFAAKMDEIDPLRDIRSEFIFPTMKDLPNGNISSNSCLLSVIWAHFPSVLVVDMTLIDNPDEECIYLCGNSLGLKPKRADKYLQQAMDDWGKMYN